MVCKLNTKIKNMILEKATSRCANFTKFCRILEIDPDNFLSVSPSLARTICKMPQKSSL